MNEGIRRVSARERIIQLAGANSAGREKKEKKAVRCDVEDTPTLKFSVRVKVPFSYSFSKNAIYSVRKSGKGRIYLRKEANSIKKSLAWEIRAASKGHKWKQNKVWLDILAQKPNHKGDAVNVVDTVCDGVKKAIKIDDRWFCIKRLDWQIVKKNPQLIVEIGQEEDEDKQICSHCGRILPLTAFTKDKSNILGVGRACKECCASKRKKRKIEKRR